MSGGARPVMISKFSQNSSARLGKVSRQLSHPCWVVVSSLSSQRRDPVEPVPEELVHADVRVVANVENGEP